MSSAYFDFKKFRVFHEKSAMKVGTDSVILGSIVPLSNPIQRAADIGCGSGLLSLMLAQRCEARIDAIEIDPEAAHEAALNFEHSPWFHRLQVHACSFQDFVKSEKEKYDLLMSNPPYYDQRKSFPILPLNRLSARHTYELSFIDLVEGAISILKDDGQFWLILPLLEAQEFIRISHESGLFLIAEIRVQPKASKEANRLVMGFAKKPAPLSKSELVVYQEDGRRSEKYSQLTEAFYL